MTTRKKGRTRKVQENKSDICRLCGNLADDKDVFDSEGICVTCLNKWADEYFVERRAEAELRVA